MTTTLSFLFGLLTVACAGQTITFRPLKVYSQDLSNAKEALVHLSRHFNVSLHDGSGLDCESLVATAQKGQTVGASLIIVVNGRGQHCKDGLWKEGFLVNLPLNTNSNRTNNSVPIRRGHLPNTVVSSAPSKPISWNWESYANSLTDHSNMIPASLYQHFVSTPETASTTEKSKKTPESGIGVPIWVPIVLAVVIVGLLGVIGFLVYKMRKSKKLPVNVEEGEKNKKVPEPNNAKTTVSTKTSETEKSTAKSDLEKSSKTEKEENRSPPKRSAESDVMRSDKLTKIKPAEPPPERSESSKLTEAVTATEFLYYLQKIANMSIDYYDDPSQYAVSTNEQPGFLFKKFSKSAPEKPDQFSSLLKFFSTSIMQGMTHWQHPRFHAYFAVGRSYPDMLADLLISSLGVMGFSWDSCPALTEMEHAMVNWIGRAMGIPESHLWQEEPVTSGSGGCYFDTASEAIFCSMLAARQWKIAKLTGKSVAKIDGESVHYNLEAIHEHCRKLVFYTSKDAHSAMEKGCKMALVRCRPIQATKENDWGMTGAQLEKEILKDVERGLAPTYVFVTLGTTSTATSDNLESIWPIAEKYEMYIHVDCGYAGMFWLDPKSRACCKGLEHAWSISSNMHYALLHSATASIFFCKDKKLHMDAFAVTPVFLKSGHKNAIDLRDWGVGQSRRFKAIKTWLIMSMYGLDGLKEYVKKLMGLGEYFMSLVAKHSNCRIFGKCNFGLFVFQYVEEGMSESEMNDSTTALARYMNDSNKAFFTHTRVSAYNLIRVAIVYERSTRTTIDESWCIMQDLIDEFKQNRANIMREQEPLQPPLPGRKRAPLPGDEDIDICGLENLNTDKTRSHTSIVTSPMPPSIIEKDK